MALASGGIFGCPLDMENATVLITTIDIPNAVRGVERSITYERIESSVPVNAKLVARVEYVFLNDMVFHF
jgi:hypothetical protein